MSLFKLKGGASEPRLTNPSHPCYRIRIPSRLDPMDFEMGYHEGCEYIWSGCQSRQQGPSETATSHAIGFIFGMRDAQIKRVRPLSCEPFNEATREMAAKFPNTWSVPK